MRCFTSLPFLSKKIEGLPLCAVSGITESSSFFRSSATFPSASADASEVSAEEASEAAESFAATSVESAAPAAATFGFATPGKMTLTSARSKTTIPKPCKYLFLLIFIIILFSRNNILYSSGKTGTASPNLAAKVTKSLEKIAFLIFKECFIRRNLLISWKSSNFAALYNKILDRIV